MNLVALNLAVTIYGEYMSGNYILLELFVTIHTIVSDHYPPPLFLIVMSLVSKIRSGGEVLWEKL